MIPLFGLLLCCFYKTLNFNLCLVAQEVNTLDDDCVANIEARLNDILLTVVNLEYADDLSLCYAILILVSVNLILDLVSAHRRVLL